MEIFIFSAYSMAIVKFDFSFAYASSLSTLEGILLRRQNLASVSSLLNFYFFRLVSSLNKLTAELNKDAMNSC